MAPYGLARIVSLVITVVIWWVVLLGATWVFSGGHRVAHVAPQTMAMVAAATLLLVPFFVTHGVLTHMLTAFEAGRFAPPDLAQDPKLRGGNPWRAAIVHTVCLGVPAAVAGYVLALRAPAETFTPGSFAWTFAGQASGVVAISVWLASGHALRRELRIAPANRPYAGGLRRYLWLRHGLPHGLVNLLINVEVAFALFPGAVRADSLVPAKLLLGDTFITFLILTVVLVPAVNTHARVDVALGIAPPVGATPAPQLSEAALLPLLVSVPMLLLLTLLLWWIPFRPSVWEWAAYRGLVFGGFSAWLAARVALSAQAVAEPATSAAA